jgi:hypothetical protein
LPEGLIFSDADLEFEQVQSTKIVKAVEEGEPIHGFC